MRSQDKANQVKRLLGGKVNVILIGNYSNKPIREKSKIEEEMVRHFKEVTGGHLFDDIVAACADPDAQRLMLKLFTPEGYGVGACFGGTHELVDRAEVDAIHYCSAKTIGTTGCSTQTMETIARWLGQGKISLKGFTNPRRFTFKDNPEEFFTIGGLKPVLYPWE